MYFKAILKVISIQFLFSKFCLYLEINLMFMLILYTETLLKLPINFTSFPKLYHTQTMTIFSFYSNTFPIYLFNPNALAKIPRKMMNRGGDSGILI